MELKLILTSFLGAIFFFYAFSVKCKLKIKRGLIIGTAIGVLTVFFINGIHYYFSNLNIFHLLIIEFVFIIFMTILIVIRRFYRDPERIPPVKNNVILSPADGTIRYIKKIEKGEVPFSTKKKNRFQLKEITKTNLLNDGAFLIGIEMSVFDVHVNRAPVGGKIVFQKYTSGKFLSLRKIESIFKNERLTTIIDSNGFQIGVVQIASRVVRRIVSYVKEEDVIEIGQRIGMIKFGSQVDLVIPKLDEIKINIRENDEVTAGVTVLATINQRY